ncbi:MAG: thymidine phosphorylase, partial [Longimicrobiales bacterium]
MIPTRVIEAKRDGGSIDSGSLRRFLTRYLDGDVEEYQMAAFLMAVVFRGLDGRELDDLVDVMIGSGASLDLSALDRPRVDKHSTGGVGDKVSIALAPLAAELGVYVPMMSGRGLGHTGGTLDKLEAIPGFRTDLDLGDFRRVLEAVGCAMIGQTAEIAPLDRRLYDLRSVTGTVPSLPLIAASIISKKLAEGLSALVLDVKVGSGAFLPDEERALTLARTMVGIGDARGVRTEALVTAMDRPLGRAVGNALETVEALECLA